MKNELFIFTLSSLHLFISPVVFLLLPGNFSAALSLLETWAMGRMGRQTKFAFHYSDDGCRSKFINFLAKLCQFDSWKKESRKKWTMNVRDIAHGLASCSCPTNLNSLLFFPFLSFSFPFNGSLLSCRVRERERERRSHSNRKINYRDIQPFPSAFRPLLQHFIWVCRIKREKTQTHFPSWEE